MAITVLIFAAAFTAQAATLETKRIALFELPGLIKKLELPEDAIIADLGAGDGAVALALAALVPKGRVIATELRADLLARLEARAKNEHRTNLETRLVGEDEPGLAERSVDLIVLCQVDHYFADRARMLKKLRAALKPSGRLVIINYEKYRAAAIADANTAGLHTREIWTPARPYYTAVLEAR